MVTVVSPAFIALLLQWTIAVLAAKDPTACYKMGSYYRGFTLKCGWTLEGTTIGNPSTTSFRYCIDNCANTTGCIAIRLERGMPSNGCTMCSKITEGPKSTPYTTDVAFLNMTEGHRSCGAIVSSDEGGQLGRFEVKCGYSINGVSFGQTDESSYEACVVKCDSLAQCSAADWRSTSMQCNFYRGQVTWKENPLYDGALATAEGSATATLPGRTPFQTASISTVTVTKTRTIAATLNSFECSATASEFRSAQLGQLLMEFCAD